ncbi:MAG: hypoxanthine phosphoribosyltransferase [Nitrospirales bacterium]|nr:hypoxanthine phosphoribosyltransferase [Nitrospirales bacterium]
MTTEQIQEKVTELADRISRDYQGKEIVALGMLKGSFVFFADLVRSLQVPVRIDFIMASSYVKSSSTGEVKVHYEPRQDLAGKHVLLIDDIIDTGISLNFIRERLLSQGPESLRICILLDKKERRVVDVPVDYLGFEIPNKFVVGYGLDYEDKYRNLPYVAVFRKEA